VEDAPVVLLFQRDLRVGDNPALTAAVESGAPVIPLFVLDDEAGAWAPGAASRWWLHHSLAALRVQLDALGVPLILRRGELAATLLDVTRAVAAKAVFWNRRHEPAAAARERTCEAELLRRGVRVEGFNATLLFEPARVRTREGHPFTVFTPFWRTCLALATDEAPLPAPRAIRAWDGALASLPLGALELEPAHDWAGEIAAAWTPGERGAHAQLERFLDERLPGYAAGRDRPDLDATSRLSPHLGFGEISARALRHASLAGAARAPRDTEAFLRQLGWREFSYHLLAHHPDLPDHPLRPEFARLPWRDDALAMGTWRRGKTGYPIVDAGMRQLWRTGWMHNRVRMIAASFLVKDLLLPWQAGERWFWETLVDADLANNSASWQWVAGCGADAAPYFRVFNPVLQGRRFDPDGSYVRRWIPELARLPDEAVHHPWSASETTLREAGVRLGVTYPTRIVDHAEARARALAAYAQIRDGRGAPKR